MSLSKFSKTATEAFTISFTFISSVTSLLLCGGDAGSIVAATDLDASSTFAMLDCVSLLIGGAVVSVVVVGSITICCGWFDLFLLPPPPIANELDRF